MRQVEADIRQFMQAMGQATPEVPDLEPDRWTLQLRMDLITEEFDETIDALIHLNRPCLSKAARIRWMAEVADGIADLVYVAVGTALALGINMEEVWDEVHRSNMAKVEGPVRPDGKRLKPEDWEPPAIERIVRLQLAEADPDDRSIG